MTSVDLFVDATAHSPRKPISSRYPMIRISIHNGDLVGSEMIYGVHVLDWDRIAV